MKNFKEEIKVSVDRSLITYVNTRLKREGYYTGKAVSMVVKEYIAQQIDQAINNLPNETKEQLNYVNYADVTYFKTSKHERVREDDKQVTIPEHNRRMRTFFHDERFSQAKKEVLDNIDKEDLFYYSKLVSINEEKFLKLLEDIILGKHYMSMTKIAKTLNLPLSKVRSARHSMRTKLKAEGRLH